MAKLFGKLFVANCVKVIHRGGTKCSVISIEKFFVHKPLSLCISFKTGNIEEVSNILREDRQSRIAVKILNGCFNYIGKLNPKHCGSQYAALLYPSMNWDASQYILIKLELSLHAIMK